MAETGAMGHLRDLLHYTATRRIHDRADAVTLDELTIDADELGLPEGVSIRWLGIAGFALSSQGTTLLIDPYVSRAPMADLLRRRPLLPDPALIDRHIPRADAVLLGHTHFDHAVDAPAIVRRDNCAVYGGRSAATLMALHALGDRAVVVEPHHPYEIGPFTVRFVPSAHSKLALGRSVPYSGEITCEHLDGLTAGAYRCGEVWGIEIEVDGQRLYHQGSADLIDEEIGSRDIDVFLAGIAGRQFTDGYVPRILSRLRPHRVVLCHHDDFFKPLDADLGLTTGVDVTRFREEVEMVSSDIEVAALPRTTPGDRP